MDYSNRLNVSPASLTGNEARSGAQISEMEQNHYGDEEIDDPCTKRVKKKDLCKTRKKKFLKKIVPNVNEVISAA